MKVLAFLVGVVSAFLFALVVTEVTSPNCSTEDSCSIDYRDGGWKITEDTP